MEDQTNAVPIWNPNDSNNDTNNEQEDIQPKTEIPTEQKIINEWNTFEKQNQELQGIAKNIEDSAEPKEIEETNKEIDVAKIKLTILLVQKKLQEILQILENKNETDSSEIGTTYSENGQKVVEGFFNGEAMIGPNGEEYSVPANYASKSRMVEGDKLKLTINENGSFVFKQIGPIERDRITGILVYDESGENWSVMHNGRPINVLTASITFYKGSVGDEVILLVPKGKESKWGAVENIIKKH